VALAGEIERQFRRVQKLSLQTEFFAKPFVEIEIAVLIVHYDRMTELGEV
jgi:hypothetical protein